LLANPAELHLATASTLAGVTTHVYGDGLILGRDQHSAPVMLRLFRPEPTLVVVVGGICLAQLLSMRAMALGAQVLVETTRPSAWEPFLRGLGAGPDIVAMTLPGHQPAHPPSLTRPQLILLDAGVTVGQDLRATLPRRAVIVLREELTAWDIDAIDGADAVVMQRLTEAEAALAAATLQVTTSQGWFSRIRPEMVALAGQGHVRWAMVSPTSIERRLFPSLARSG
jgi:hypothetical protein